MDRTNTTQETVEQTRERLIGQLENPNLTEVDISRIRQKLTLLDEVSE